MLTKLLKYDFKATGRIILPIAGGVLLLNFVSDLLGHYVNNTSHTMPWVGFFMGLLTLATFLGMLAVLAICFFASVQRYYKLLGERIYFNGKNNGADKAQHLSDKANYKVADDADGHRPAVHELHLQL